MKPPSKKATEILLAKTKRFTTRDVTEYGGVYTYYEIKVLTRHFKVKTDQTWKASYYEKQMAKGINDQSWFYFTIPKHSNLKGLWEAWLECRKKQPYRAKKYGIYEPSR